MRRKKRVETEKERIKDKKTGLKRKDSVETKKRVETEKERIKDKKTGLKRTHGVETKRTGYG